MNRLKGIYVILVCVGMLSCGVLNSSHRDEPYPPSLMPTLMYSEAVKATLMGSPPSYPASLLRRVIAIDSTHAPSYYELAKIYSQIDPAKAIDYSRTACRLDTTNIWYRNQSGHLMIATHQYDKAFDIYRELISLAPYNVENYRMLAALYDERKQPFTAIAVLDSAEYKLGRQEELMDLKRQLLINVSLFDKAISETKTMIEEYPWNIENYRILAGLYNRTNKDSLAVASYNYALSLDSTNIATLSEMNDYYRRKSNLPAFFATSRKIMASDQAELKNKISFIEEFRNNQNFYNENFFQIRDLISVLLIKYPNDYDVMALYAATIISSSGVEPALEFYKSHIKEPGVPLHMFTTVLEMETYLKRPDSLAKYTAMALERFPNDPGLYLHNGGAMSFLERDKEAMESYNKALKLAPSDSVRSVVLGVMGDQYYKMEDKRNSFRYYEQALKKWSDNASVLNNFSYYLSTQDNPSQGDLNRAVELARHATTIEKGNATFLDSYAWALFLAGQYAEAKKVMQQAVSLDSSDSDVLYIHYGDILYELKEYFMASVYWKKALEKGYDAQQIEERLKRIEGK